MANPIPWVGGGNLRAYRSLLGYVKAGFKIQLVLPYTTPFDKDVINLLKSMQIKLEGKCKEPLSRKLGLRRIISNIEASIYYNPGVHIENLNQIDCILSMHENPEALVAVYNLAKNQRKKCIAVLQLPPFYCLKERIQNLEICRKIWLEELYGKSYGTLLAMVLNRSIRLLQHRIKLILHHFDKLIAVSPSIPIEMGVSEDKIVSLYPGIALDEEDLNLIKVSKKTTKKDYVIFSARLAPDKGIIDTLQAFAKIVRRTNNVKLIVTGGKDQRILAMLKRIARRLGILKQVKFMGYVSREELFKLKARSKVMIYPSHVDAVPYTVLETLHLNTPIVAYDIPAIRVNYGEFQGVSMVKEFDIDGLAEETINFLKDTPKVEAPNWTNWDEIVDQEISIIREVIGVD